MFKQIVTDLIGQQLNSFIEDFDSNSIHFTGFPSSNLRLNHLRIKPDALSALQLPVVLKHGYVGSLHIVIPFAGLKSTPVQINLENVFIVAGLVKKFDGQEHIKGMRKATDQAILAANVAEEADSADGRPKDNKVVGRIYYVWPIVLRQMAADPKAVHVEQDL